MGGEMDEQAVERITRARGGNDPFARRAGMAVRNRKDNEAAKRPKESEQEEKKEEEDKDKKDSGESGK
ncbi:hypothetical protein F5X96DRAFT_670437 [Biscogniauxia mediterranea]|nr:hypothetical protein F5X96DRAFT_670437 [Biscogniauxia mediterranea]